MKSKAIQQIIVGVDFSRYSKLVVKEAQKLAKTMKIPLRYVYVNDVFQFVGEPREVAEKKLTEKVYKFYKLKKDTDVVIRTGDAPEQLIEAAKASQLSPLIMVGHKGMGAIARFLLGSTAERVALLSPFPVWIHRGQKVLLPKKILVPSDFSKHTDTTLNQVQSFDKAFKSNLELFHVIQEPTPVVDLPIYSLVYQQIHSDDDRSFADFKKSHPNYKTVRDIGEVAEQVEERSRKFDLVAFSPRGKGESTPFLGRVAAKLVRSGNKPVLICP